MSKMNLPVDGTDIYPNKNNLTGESKKYQELCYKFPRQSSGQISFTAYPSGIVYNTEDFPGSPNIFNRGEEGLMNLLFEIYGGANGFIIGAEDLGGGGGGGGDVFQGEFTYAELATMISEKSLKIGGKYALSDYQTKYIQPWTLLLKVASKDKLLLTAITDSSFDIVCTSFYFPQDTVYYDFNNNLCEDGTTPRNGFISRRIDNLLEIDYPEDWRNMLYARWGINPTTYLRGNINTEYSVWTSGQQVTQGYVYKVNTSLYISIANGVPSDNTDYNYFQSIGNLSTTVYPDNTDSFIIFYDCPATAAYLPGSISLLRDKISPPSDYSVFRFASNNMNIKCDWGVKKISSSKYDNAGLMNTVFLSIAVGVFSKYKLKNCTFCGTSRQFDISSETLSGGAFMYFVGECRDVVVSGGLNNMIVLVDSTNINILNSMYVYLLNAKSVSVDGSGYICTSQSNNLRIYDSYYINFKNKASNINVDRIGTSYIFKFYNLSELPQVGGALINIVRGINNTAAWYHVNFQKTGFAMGDIPISGV